MGSITKKRVFEIVASDKVLVFRKALLEWYDIHARHLPWRARGKEAADPYYVWLSEIMLQQTTVAAVIPYFQKFIVLWPDIHALARAEIDDVMKAWAGLGYYARARNLHKCAKLISEQYQGSFPYSQEDLIKLPGIGVYTSEAIAAIAFGRPANVVDGNVERVFARYHAISDPFPFAKKQVWSIAHAYSMDQQHRPGDYAQALMDLGARICTPKNALCGSCPVNSGCVSFAKGRVSHIPVKKDKIPIPLKVGHVYWVTNHKGEVLLHRRHNNGMLGGMVGLPTTEWVEEGGRPDLQHLKSMQKISFVVTGKSVKHTFTHFRLNLEVFTACVSQNMQICDEYSWYDRSAAFAAVPTLFKKVFKICDEANN